MLTIKRTSRFKKQYRLALKRGCDPAIFEFVLCQLANERPLPEKYLDHALMGEWAGFRECHLVPNWLLIYFILLSAEY
jgi:mRNA interferase YafQ